MGKPKQFCKRGHDTAAVGRDRWSTCRQCTWERKRSEPYLAQQRLYDAGRRGSLRRLESQRRYDAKRGVTVRRIRQEMARKARAVQAAVKSAISRLDPILQDLFR